MESRVCRSSGLGRYGLRLNWYASSSLICSLWLLCFIYGSHKFVHLLSMFTNRFNVFCNNIGSFPFLEDKLGSEVGSAQPLQPNTEELIKALEDVHLGYLLSHFSGLDTTNEWSSVLSLGEQQLAFACLLLSRPDLVLLDESTSALDEANEAHLYDKINAAGITYISIGHQTSLRKFHKKALRISSMDLDSNPLNWCIEPCKKARTLILK
ncbi:ABC transporter D family member 2, chloroplastic-like [Helianthus annuus]|uniref:ABC transporter D family member 2, chloroplastic-like n=1 Tax=Helianthus annuus TaxID=4232 RepID=UPI0016530DC7|nr:ABC transporter D family member 2, chloroplastic-like [Helianthus annuus]